MARGFESKDVEQPAQWSVHTRETADHSLLFAVAAVLIDGGLTPETYDRERWHDGDVHALIARASIDIVPAFDDGYANGIRCCEIEALTADGARCIARRRVTFDDVEIGRAHV